MFPKMQQHQQTKNSHIKIYKIWLLRKKINFFFLFLFFLFFILFLSYSCRFNTHSALTGFILSGISMLSTPATHLSEISGARASTDESPVPPPFHAAATLPHLRFIQNIASIFYAAHSQPLHILVPFYSSSSPPLFLRLLCFWSSPGENLQLERAS